MTDYVFSAADYLTVENAAKALGWFDVDSQSIQQTGEIASGGNWFFNYVGPVQGQAGVWGRLRLNGDSAFLSTLPAGVFTIYHYDDILGGWTSDGVNLAPSFVQNVGVIA